MSVRLGLVAVLAFSSLALAPSIGQAQTQRVVTVEWQNAPLSRVVEAFATFSGQTVAVAPNVGDPEVTATLRNVDWRFALDTILARQGLIARVDASGVLRIEKRVPGAPTGNRRA
jgi:type II secretory pathway component HofQ